MAESRKVLVAFDPDNPEKRSNDFLVAVKDEDGSVCFIGTRSRGLVSYGMVVLTSNPVNQNDLLAKLVDTGQKIRDVDEALSLAASYLEQTSGLKLGNVVELDDGTEDGLALLVVARTPSGFKKKRADG